MLRCYETGDCGTDWGFAETVEILPDIGDPSERQRIFWRSFATICTSINAWEVRGEFCNYCERPNTFGCYNACLILNR